MDFDLEYWISLYQGSNGYIAAIDVETTKYDGPISVVGISARKNGLFAPVFEEVQLVKNKTLSEESIRWALRNAKLLLTFNGKSFDLPKIIAEYPNAMPPGVKMVDLYLLAKQLGLSTDLKTLEKTFSIKRPKNAEQKGRTSNLWKQHEENNDLKALQALLGYNQRDARNLFELADKLIYWARLKVEQQKRIHKAIIEATI